MPDDDHDHHRHHHHHPVYIRKLPRDVRVTSAGRRGSKKKNTTDPSESDRIESLEEKWEKFTPRNTKARFLGKRRHARPPRRYSVLLHNDDTTSFSFVVSVLEDIFHFSLEDAVSLTEQVDSEGIAVAGFYPHGIAETKCAIVGLRAEREGHPLVSTIAPENDLPEDSAC